MEGTGPARNVQPDRLNGYIEGILLCKDRTDVCDAI